MRIERTFGEGGACKVIDLSAMTKKIGKEDLGSALMWAQKEIDRLGVVPEITRFSEFGNVPDDPDIHVSMFMIDANTALWRCSATFENRENGYLQRRPGSPMRVDRITYKRVINFAELYEKNAARVEQLLRNGAYLALRDVNPLRAKAQFR